MFLINAFSVAIGITSSTSLSVILSPGMFNEEVLLMFLN